MLPHITSVAIILFSLQRITYLCKPQLRRHWLRPNEDLTKVTLVEEEFFDSLNQKMEQEQFMSDQRTNNTGAHQEMTTTVSSNGGTHMTNV